MARCALRRRKKEYSRTYKCVFRFFNRFLSNQRNQFFRNPIIPSNPRAGRLAKDLYPSLEERAALDPHCAVLPAAPHCPAPRPPPVGKGPRNPFFDALSQNNCKGKKEGLLQGARITAAILPTAIPDGAPQNAGELHRLDLSCNRIATVTVETFATGVVIPLWLSPGQCSLLFLSATSVLFVDVALKSE